MEKMVSTVFKILGASIILMFLLDTSLMLIEVISVHSKVSNIMGMVQMEVAKNNCMPDEMADGFEKYFIENLTESKLSPEFTTNFRKTGAYNDEEALAESAAGEYGQFKRVKVDVLIHPSYVYFANKGGSSSTRVNSLVRGNPTDIVLSYEYTVPCLRYLK